MVKVNYRYRFCVAANILGAIFKDSCDYVIYRTTLGTKTHSSIQRLLFNKFHVGKEFYFCFKYYVLI